MAITKIVKSTFSPAEDRLLSNLSSDKWATRAELARRLGKPRLIPNEIRALTKLAQRDIIDMQEEVYGETSTFYYRKKESNEQEKIAG